MKLTLVNSDWHVVEDEDMHAKCGIPVSVQRTKWGSALDVWCAPCRAALGDPSSEPRTVRDESGVVHVGPAITIARTGGDGTVVNVSLETAPWCGRTHVGDKTGEPASCLACLAHARSS